MPNKNLRLEANPAEVFVEGAPLKAVQRKHIRRSSMIS
jgi:hypothetical protein